MKKYLLLCAVEGKSYFGEGGLRVPGIAWWPGTIKAGQVSPSVMSLMDLYPTLLDIAGVSPDSLNVTLDGRSRRADMLGSTVTSRAPAAADDVLYFYCWQRLVAARVGAFKVYFRRSLFPDESRRREWCREGVPTRYRIEDYCPDTPLDPWLVYNVEADPGEAWPLSVDRLGDDVVSMLNDKLADVSGDEFHEPLLTVANIRPNLCPCCSPPYCVCSETAANGV